MAPYVEARQGLILFGVALIIIVAGAGVLLARGVARPLNVLTEAARSMMAGNYDVNVEVASKDEVGELASSFNAMTAAIAERTNAGVASGASAAEVGGVDWPARRGAVQRATSRVAAVLTRLGRPAPTRSTSASSLTAWRLTRAMRVSTR